MRMLEQLIPARRNFDGADLIFTLNAAAQKRSAAGEAVINATVGALLDDDGRLVVLRTVMEQYRQLSPLEISPYAPITGDPAYLLALTQRHWPELSGYGVGVATPGGTGALALSLRNLLEPGQTLLTAAPFWGPYATLAVENGVQLATVPYPDIGGALDVAAWRTAALSILQAQRRLVLWLNDPCHNPTGRSLSAPNRFALLSLIKELSAHGAVTLILDLAYLDYARDPQAVRDALDAYRAFGERTTGPDSGPGARVLVGAALSLSKAFTLYGARAGALVFPWSREAALAAALAISCRGTFSNCARAPMSVMVRVSRDVVIQAALADEQAYWSGVLATRVAALHRALQSEGLEGATWDGGFFVTLTVPEPFAVCERLQAQGVFVVPMREGLRVGVCGLKTADAPRFAAALRLSLPPANANANASTTP